MGFEKAQVHASILMGVVPTLLSSLAILVFIWVTSPLPLSHRLWGKPILSLGGVCVCMSGEACGLG